MLEKLRMGSLLAWALICGGVAACSGAEMPPDDGGVGSLCGGFAGLPCDEGLTCVDDPRDTCDPDNGGADCGGVCVEQCGETTCGPGTTCCNPLRGICTRPGMVCIQ
jgi:hypothetical protein